AQSERGSCAISLGDDPDALLRDLQDRFPTAKFMGGDETFERLVAQVGGFVEVPTVGLNLPRDVRGTASQERVWRALMAVPGGRHLYRDWGAYWRANRGAGGGSRVRHEHDCGCDPLPPGRAARWRFVGLSLGRSPQARTVAA